MTIRHLSPRQKTFRAMLGWAVSVALAFHGLIPPGYMPDSTRRMTMTICSGMDMSLMAMGDAAPSDDGAAEKNKTGSKAHAQAPCPFSINAVFTFGGMVTNLVLPVYLFIAAVVFAAFSFTAERRYGNAAPRAPPHFA